MSTQTESRIAQRPVADARARMLADLPVAEQRLDLAGILTAVLEGGDGPPIVLLHGPAEHAAKWFSILPDLVRSARVIAPDLPGHGSTEVADGVLNGERVIAWLDELIARTCSTAPLLVGQIIGGAIAARYAALHSDRISGLVLSDSLGLTAFQPQPAFQSALMNYMMQPSGETHDQLWQQCAYDLDRMQRRIGEKWEQLRAYNLDRARVSSLQAVQESLFAEFGIPPIPDEELTRIKAPVTLVWGRHDRATSLQVAEAASQRFGWPLHIIEDAGDDPAIEQPDAFVQAVLAAARRQS